MEKIKILALGGLDEDGRDLYCIEINDDILVIGGGIRYPTKNTPGIDFIISNFSYLIQNKHKVKGYIIPKGKKSSFGAIPYIYKEVPAPIYCTGVTKRILIDFSMHYQQNNDYKFRIVDLPSTITINNHVVDLFSTCASVPNTFGLSIRTQLGNIVYSGDFIIEYANADYFKLDLNTLGKIAEHPTLILLSESVNAKFSGYCAPGHKLTGFLEKYFEEATGRIFIALSSDNLYRIKEAFNVCKQFNKKVYLYDNEISKIYSLAPEYFYGSKNIISTDDVLRVKEQNLVILMADEGSKIYEKIFLLTKRENENKQIYLQNDDTFIVASPPTDSTEVIATAVVDDLYKSGCKVKYINAKMIHKMHAYQEDLSMLLSLLKPKYYLPIKGYYVDLLANAQVAFDMNIGLSHSNIFLLDNGQSLSITEKGVNVDYDIDGKVDVSDVMIDGIGVGDVVNEIINERTRLSEDGVVVIGCGVSTKKKEIICSTDVQMRGFLFLKDKEADLLLKEVIKLFNAEVESWLKSTTNFNNKIIETQITQKLSKLMLKNNNRNPVIKVNVMVIE